MSLATTLKPGLRQAADSQQVSVANLLGGYDFGPIFQTPLDVQVKIQVGHPSNPGVEYSSGLSCLFWELSSATRKMIFTILYLYLSLFTAGGAGGAGGPASQVTFS